MSLRDLFHSGQYREVLAASIDSAAGGYPDSDLPFVIGALTFRGRLDEAEHLFNLRRASMCPLAQVIARFFLGVGSCRVSNYKAARAHFGANLRFAGRHSDAFTRFYAWQGVGFYRLFLGRYGASLRNGKRALNAAVEAGYLYGKALAYDLIGHSQLLPGEISVALSSLDAAIEFGLRLGDGGLVEAFRVSRAVHSAQFGLDPANDLANLKILLNQNSAQDNYSKARLLLEIARQETLRGDLKAARAVLNQACPLIYAARNRRYSILLNMRYAYLHLLEGELHAALNLIGNARRELDPTVDQTLSFEVSGLECQILRALGKQQCIGELQSHIAQLELAKDRSGRAIHRRIKHRDATSGEIVAYHGDDPLGDLLDLAARSPDQAIPVAIERGYHGILRHAVPDAAGKRLLLFDLVPDTLVIFDRGSVAVQRSSAVLRAIAKRLMLGEASKQQLIETVWGYRYQPLKHDALVYRSMSRFRQLLGERAHWLTATEQGYQLSGEVAIRFHHTKPRLVETPQIEMPQQKPEESSQADINFRQMQILAHLKERDMIDVKYCSEAFSVSEITARRDLSELVQMSYLSRVGNGRATRYRLGGAHGPSH